MPTHNISPAVEERTTPRLIATIKDDNGVVIPGTSLTTLTLTLTDLRTGDIINSRENFDIKSFVNISGVLSFRLEEDDMVLVGDNEPGAERVLVALIIGTYDSGNGRFMDRVYIPVFNEEQVS